MSNLEIVKSRIIAQECIDPMLAYWRFKNYTIVFTNGCFDILHKGHADFLARASDLGDVLVVGLNTDRSVRSIKGPSRPLLDEASRSFLLASFSFVNAVILFDQDTPVELITLIKPDVLVKGNDYKPEEVVGREIVTAGGGKVITLGIVEGYSTSAIVNKTSG